MRLYVTLLIEKHSLDELDTLDETTKKFAHRYLEMYKNKVITFQDMLKKFQKLGIKKSLIDVIKLVNSEKTIKHIDNIRIAYFLLNNV